MSWTDRDWDPQFDVLMGISHAFGSISDPNEALEASVRWLRKALADESAGIRISVTRGSRLKALYVVGDVGDVHLKSRRAIRKLVIESKSSQVRTVGRGSLAVMPLITRGLPIGLVEIMTPADRIHERWNTVTAVASQIAILLRNIQERIRLENDLRALSDPADLTRRLLAAATPREAVAAAVRYCRETYGLPVAGWLHSGTKGCFQLVSARGIGSERGIQLRNKMRAVPWRGSEPSLDPLVQKFRLVTGRPHVEVVEAGEAVLLISGAIEPGRQSLDAFAELLSEVIDHIAAITRAKLREERLDIGLAWTAHELRGPLIVARGLVERLLSANDPTVYMTLLERSGAELSLLGELVDSLLEWSVGKGELRIATTDLREVVQRSIDSCSLEIQDERIILDAPTELIVEADRVQLGTAIGNVIRNALVYSSRNEKIQIRVAREGKTAVITVHDEGPGVPLGEEDAIFDPFMRGNGSEHRTGKGLGLFIARRIVEAHRGRIWVEPTCVGDRGTTFLISLPLAAPGGRA